MAVGIMVMMYENNLHLIYNISQLLTLAGGPQRGRDLGKPGIIEDGAVVMESGQVIEVGTRRDLIKDFPQAAPIDAGGQVVMPGFVDPHTHMVWAGDRADEFTRRLQGHAYLEILESGGGILSTVRSTRAASPDELTRQTKQRLWQAFSHGTTTVEIKTGYGLAYEAELKQLQVILALEKQVPMDIAATFMGAHAFPPEFKDQHDAYVEQICEQMLPGLHDWWQSNQPGRSLPFVDVFCEQGVFSLIQSRQILEQAKNLGYPLKIHVDEFENLGGASLAVELGAASADHVVKTSAEDIQRLGRSDTVAVSLPGTPFGLGEEDYSPAGAILEAGGLLALATDTNPGTSWCESMQFIIALACRNMGLTPAQAIAGATINAAAALQMDHQVGSIEPGKQADMLILSVDDYRQLGYRFGTNLVSKVIKKGRLFPIYHPAVKTAFLTGLNENG